MSAICGSEPDGIIVYDDYDRSGSRAHRRPRYTPQHDFRRGVSCRAPGWVGFELSARYNSRLVNGNGWRGPKRLSTEQEWNGCTNCFLTPHRCRQSLRSHHRCDDFGATRRTMRAHGLERASASCRSLRIALVKASGHASKGAGSVAAALNGISNLADLDIRDSFFAADLDKMAACPASRTRCLAVGRRPAWRQFCLIAA